MHCFSSLMLSLYLSILLSYVYPAISTPTRRFPSQPLTAPPPSTHLFLGFPPSQRPRDLHSQIVLSTTAIHPILHLSPAPSFLLSRPLGSSPSLSACLLNSSLRFALIHLLFPSVFFFSESPAPSTSPLTAAQLSAYLPFLIFVFTYFIFTLLPLLQAYPSLSLTC